MRGDGTAFAGDFRGDPLGEFAEGAIVEEEREFGLAEHVNEAGRNDPAFGVDFAFGVGFAHIADRRDAIPADGHVSRIPGIS